MRWENTSSPVFLFLMVIITFNASSGESQLYAHPLMVVLSTVSKRPLDTAANVVTAEAASKLMVRMVPVNKCLNFIYLLPPIAHLIFKIVS